MKPFFAALQFLTIVPVPQGLAGDEKSLSLSVPFFPVVGILVGMMAVSLDAALISIIPPFPASVIVVIFMMAISGGLHMDGLADTADGFFSARPRERILEIMRDSHIGAMGVMSIVAVFLFKLSLLVSLPLSLRWPVIIMMPVAGRCALLITMNILPYARSGGGLADLFHLHRSVFFLPWAIIFLGAAGWLTAQWSGLIITAASLGCALMLAFFSYRKIGGYTGDTLGAACEITELIPALTALVLLHYGMFP